MKTMVIIIPIMTIVMMIIITATIIPMTDSGHSAMNKFFRLIQFADSALPVGTFSFSNGLETAAHMGIVHDAKSLESYARAAAAQAAFSDAVAALCAWRAAMAGDYARLCLADRSIMDFRMNDEARQMLCRMGKKLAELGVRLYGDTGFFGRWLGDIALGNTPGTFPVAQGLAFATDGLGEGELFAAHQYGVINMILSAALRCVRVSHYETQIILFRLGQEVGEAYRQARTMELENMHSFVPQMDILASLHEKGAMRMFMN